MTWTGSEDSDGSAASDDEREPLLRRYGLYVGVACVAVGIYILYFSGVGIPISLYKPLDEVHLATLYAAIAIYIAKSLVPRFRWGSLCSIALLVVSGYTGALVESQELHFLQYYFIPPFIVAEACSARFRALCDHHGVIAISVSLIEAFIVLLWCLYKALHKRSTGGS